MLNGSLVENGCRTPKRNGKRTLGTMRVKGVSVTKIEPN